MKTFLLSFSCLFLINSCTSDTKQVNSSPATKEKVGDTFSKESKMLGFSLIDSGQIKCTSVQPVDKKYYLQHKRIATTLDTNNLPVKKNHEIKFKFGKKNIVLKDDLSNEGYREYYFAGVDHKRNWLLIKEQDFHQQYYYLFNINVNSIDTLVGFPYFFGDMIVCLEGVYTDGPGFFEVWGIKSDRIKLRSKFSFIRSCEIYPDEVYLSNRNELVVKDTKNNYWKVKL